MGKLTDVAIRAWIKAGERFEGRTDGDGLVLTWRPDRTTPHWRLRYRFAGQLRVMNLGSYTDLPLAAARQSAKELRAKIALGHDVAGEKQERKSTALARIEAARSVTTVGQLADEYFERMINGRWKHPNIVRSRIEKDIKPHLGKLALDAVEPRHIDAMLRAVVKRGAPTIANDVLRWVRRMFDYAIKRHLVRFNPAAAFDLADAGGKELARERALSRDELVTLFEAMRQAKGFSVQYELTVIRSSVELGTVIREQRKRLALKQLDLAGLGNTGNRFIVDLENGKPTVQLQKVLDLMDLLGLEVVVRTKASRSTSSL